VSPPTGLEPARSAALTAIYLFFCNTSLANHPPFPRPADQRQGEQQNALQPQIVAAGVIPLVDGCEPHCRRPPWPRSPAWRKSISRHPWFAFGSLKQRILPSVSST
jgi:hypothetical protein